MPYNVDPNTHCASCPFDYCVEDRRVRRVHGRDTNFRILQSKAAACTFDNFVPGGEHDVDTNRELDDYIQQLENNFGAAGEYLFPGQYNISSNAKSKITGDIFELLILSALWNACAFWNTYMDGEGWQSNTFDLPADAVPTPKRKVGVVQLPHGYDATRLFQSSVRRTVEAHETALRRRDMELGLSAPDIVGFRLPEDLGSNLGGFKQPIEHLGLDVQDMLKNARTSIEGTLDGPEFMFAMAVKRSPRSDRLYQPLFEANVLKYLIEEVLRGSSFQFYVLFGHTRGAAVEARYRAASLHSLLRGGEPSRAIADTITEKRPASVAQYILHQFPSFPL